MKLSLTCALVFCCLPLFADEPANEAMKPAASMVGTWKGTGWIDMQGGREEFAGIEVVQWKLDKTVIMIEGRHTAKGNPDQVVHHAMAVVSASPDGKLNMNAYTSRGHHTNSPMEVKDGLLIWGFDQGPAKIRFQINIKNDEWIETGEMSIQGGPARKFFEMKLKRVKK